VKQKTPTDVIKQGLIRIKSLSLGVCYSVSFNILPLNKKILNHPGRDDDKRSNGKNI
jgi:hypothetical protein